MEYLVEFQVHIPEGTPGSVATHRQAAEAIAAADLADQGRLVRLWSLPVAAGDTRALGLYRADTRAELDALVADLPLYEWMQVTVTPLAPHPNDPEASRTPPGPAAPGAVRAAPGTLAKGTQP